MKDFIAKNNILKVLYSCIFFSSLLVMLCSCSKIYEFEEFDELPNPYKNKTSSEFIAVFGDIQYYTNATYIDLFKRSLDWIEYVSNDINILCTLHTGDITQGNDKHEWSNFKKATGSLAEKIPFISNIGDHDYTWDEKSKITSRNSTQINEYIRFPLVTKKIESEFESGRIENIVVRNEIHGERYDLLLLELAPRKEVVEWAKNWVESHPEIKYILMNHRYLAKGGESRASDSETNMRLKDTDYTTPNQLWKQLIKCNDNIAWVLCGHVGGLYAVKYEKNDFGREVCQIQHNIQGEQFRYDNWLMMWEFPEACDEAVVSIVNTKTGELYNSNRELFTFKYRY